MFIKFKPQCTAECFWEFPILDGLGFLLFPRKLEPKPLRVLSDVNTPQFVWIFFSLWLSFLVLLDDCERYFSQYSRCLLQTVSFFYQNYTKLRQILGLSHLLCNSKRDQCRGMFCVSLLASHLFAYTWEKSQTVRRLGLLSHFDCYKIGVHWLIFVNCLSSYTWQLTSWS